MSRWHAAVLALGDDAALGYRTAAAALGAWPWTVPTEVVVPTTAGIRGRDGIVVHRAALPAADVTVQEGLRVTTPLRTLLDVAAVLPPRRLEQVFEELQVRHRLSPVDVATTLVTRPRRRGNAQLRVLLSTAVDPADVASVLELRFLRFCNAHGIPRPLVNVPVGIWTPDFRWDDARVIVETDGARFHMTAARRARDARKDADMRAIGYTVLRLTWADIHAHPAATAARIITALASGATSVA